MDDDEILALVSRLARPHPSGGKVIERAAILAADPDFPAVLDWIMGHAGRPEAAVAFATKRGLHGSRVSGITDAASRPPVRFVLPAGTLS